ncbi:hypothetical protein DRQ33_05415 [bacterium]|nr:MAG: hypothetical protein DRQ33_05415 [bacterium]
MKSRLLFGCFVTIALTLFSFSSADAQCYEIPEVYANLSTLLGDTICVSGDFTSPYDSMLVHFYYTWTREEPMPEHSKAKLTGVIPSGNAECGGYIEMQAIVSKNDTLDAGDTLVILEVLVWTLILPGDCDAGSMFRIDEYDEEALECDSCKFALIVSGGEKMRHWKKLLKMYRHKIDNGYCPENIYALYGFAGISREPDSLPSTELSPCDKNNIRSAHQEIARKVAECHRAGKKAKVQKLFDEHGLPGGGIWIWDDVSYARRTLPAETLLTFQQMIIDSSNDSTELEIIDEFIQCYGGSTAVVLRNGLRPKGGTVVRGNADAGVSVPAYGTDAAPWDKYLDEKLQRLAAGDSYDEAVRKAQEAYREWLRNQLPRKRNLIQWYNDIIACMDAGTSAVCSSQYAGDGNWYRQNNNPANRNRLAGKRDSLVADSTREATHADGSGVIFKKQKLSTYCETLFVNVPPGDQIVVRFPDSATGMNCGNITVYVDTASSPPPNKWVRVRIWNWNNPGSHGYTAGNERRVINSSGTGRYAIHYDNRWGTSTIEVESRQTVIYDESPSNVPDYANISFGWRDSSIAEFNPYLIGDYLYLDNAGLDGFGLEQMPGYICPRGFGIAQLDMFMGEMDNNIFWEDMELWLNILDVPVPGTLQIMAEGFEFPIHNIYIEEPGIYTAHLGSFITKDITVAPFLSLSGDSIAGASFAWDCWGMRTLYDATVHIDQKVSVKPTALKIYPNYPDPFNATTLVTFDIAESGQIRAEVLDISGHIVSVPIAGGSYRPGTHKIRLDMSNFSSGVYFVRISDSKASVIERIILIK